MILLWVSVLRLLSVNTAGESLKQETTQIEQVYLSLLDCYHNLQYMLQRHTATEHYCQVCVHHYFLVQYLYRHGTLLIHNPIDTMSNR